jgi:hypothetical protein
MLRKLALSSFLAVAGIGILSAQNNPLSSEVQQSWTRTKTNLLAAAEKMPEESYSFKPAPESQSFRDLVAHTADSAAGTCSGYNGERRQLGAASKTSKADLVAAFKEAVAECDKAYSSLTDAKATEMIEARGGKRSRLGVLYGNVIHLEHEYAQMAVHLRLKGIVPPSSERRR